MNLDLKTVNNTAVQIIEGTISLLLIVFLGFLSVLSFFIITEFPENYAEIPQVILKFSVVSFISLLVLIGIIRHLLNRINIKLLFIISSLFIVAISLIWIFSIHYIPQADQELLLEVIESLRYGSFYAIEKGGYLSRCQNQLGITLFMEVLYLLPGDTLLLFQICNIVSLPILLYGLACCYWWMFKNENGIKLLCVLFILFLPLVLYTSYFYGILLSVTFAVLSASKVIKYCETLEKKDMLKSVFFFAIAYCFKTNTLIIVIAASCALFYVAMKTISIKFLLSALFLLGSIFVVDRTVRLVYEVIARESIYPGMPNSGFIAMGLQETEKGVPGWFNAYNHIVYLDNDRNQNKADQAAKIEIANRIAIFKEDPKYALSFFGGKFLTQWMEPTFQSLWISKVNDSESQWINNLYYGKLNDIFISFLDGFQSIIYLFAFIGCFYQKNSLEKRILLISVFGGFLFHMIWEAKSQYILQYFILLIPMSTFGLEYVYCKLSVLLKSCISKK